MNLSDISTVKKLLSENGFTFKKSLGQNFLVNPSVCPKMAELSCDKDTGVLEIGPGFGVLTSALAENSKKVVAIELDDRLKNVLPKTLAQHSNVKVIFGDAMKLDLKKIIEDEFSECKKVAVCANLPYYITSPIIMMLLESKLPVAWVTVMVQKEAAERLCAAPGTKECGAISVAVSYYSNPELLFLVDRNSFLPAPNVDSAVIKLNILKNPSVTVHNEANFFRFVKAAFAQRRKTLTNSVSSTLNIPKDAINKALESIGALPTVRAEQLTIDDLARLSDILM